MLENKATQIISDLETARQVRNELKNIFPLVGMRVKVQRRKGEVNILVEWDKIVCIETLEGVLKRYVGYFDVYPGLRLPLVHSLKTGEYCRYQIDSIAYKTISWRTIVVSLEDKNMATRNWRLWRLTSKEFKEKLEPYLNRWTKKNINLLYQVIVENETQADVASKAGITKQTMNEILQRGFKVYINAIELQNTTPEKNR